MSVPQQLVQTSANGDTTSTRGVSKLAGLVRHSNDNSNANQSNSVTLGVGDLPIQFTATDISGNPASLRQYKGKIVLLDFWATWCEPCCEEVPNVVAAYNKYHAKGFDVLAVSLDNNLNDLRQFIKAKHMPYRQICDGRSWEGRIAQLYGVGSIPHSILIGRTGVILAIDPRGTDLAPAIRDALANKTPPSNTQAAF
jgi:peroxiredoxin